MIYLGIDVASEKLDKAYVEVPVEETDIVCELCGSKMIIKNGRFGKFAASRPAAPPTMARCQPSKAAATSLSTNWTNPRWI